MAKLWDRYRFETQDHDYAPVRWPPPGPYFSGVLGYAASRQEGGHYRVVICYLPHGSEALLEYWPYAKNVELLDSAVEIYFSDNFPCPLWWDQEKEEMRNG